MMKKVLHITAHMGGGGGKVLSGIAAFVQKNGGDYQHRIVLLEKPEKLNFVDICREHNIDISVVVSREELIKLMQVVDIVQVEWWHHPLITGLLSDFPQTKVRLVVWSHVSGCYYPYIPEKFLTVPERFVFTSAYSLDNAYWSDEGKQYAERNCPIVNSSGGFSHIDNKKIAHKNFNVGYVGTQSYAKLKREFVDYCHAVSAIDGICFTMVGDQTNQSSIICEAERLGIADKFRFIDYVANVNDEFAKLDVFGYLLSPIHFGTTENVLLEAMAAGLPVICMRQCAEQYLIEDGETGILVNNKSEYKQAVLSLYANPAERERLGTNARRFVLTHFAVEKTVGKLHKIYDEVMLSVPRKYDFTTVFGREAYQVFLHCLPMELEETFAYSLSDGKDETSVRKLFRKLPVILREKSKSSIEQFYRVYFKDAVLRYWCELLKNTTK